MDTSAESKSQPSTELQRPLKLTWGQILVGAILPAIGGLVCIGIFLFLAFGPIDATNGGRGANRGKTIDLEKELLEGGYKLTSTSEKTQTKSSWLIFNQEEQKVYVSITATRNSLPANALSYALFDEYGNKLSSAKIRSLPVRARDSGDFVFTDPMLSKATRVLIYQN